MYDSNEETLGRSVTFAQAALQRMELHGLLAPGAAAPCTALLRRASSMEDAVRDAQFVQETVFEEYEVKAAVWQEIEAYAPADAVIASSTSGLLISRMAKALKRPERALVAHPFNPPHLINLVELVPGAATAPAVLSTVRGFFAQLGKAPVVLQREVPGHVANRLAAAVWREATSLVHRGVASVADVDRALHEGPGVRWAIMGQHAIFDLGGGPAGYRGFFDGPIGKTCFEQIWPDMDTWPRAPHAAKEAAIRGLGEWHRSCGRSRDAIPAWRDELLCKIIALKRAKPLAASSEAPP